MQAPKTSTTRPRRIASVTIPDGTGRIGPTPCSGKRQPSGLGGYR